MCDRTIYNYETGEDEQCPNPETEPHPCPFRVEVNGDYESLCTCCHDCECNCRENV